MAQKMGPPDVASILEKGKADQQGMITDLDKFLQKHDPELLEKWQAPTKKKNPLLHELVEMGCYDVLKHAVEICNINPKIYRATDGLSLLEFMKKKKAPPELIDYFERIIAAKRAESKDDDDDEDSDGDDKATDPEESDTGDDKTHKMNIVWMDLEMTSIDEPKVMECAVIITDRRLEELARDQWVVHYDENELKSLGNWHQNQFKSKDKGGNGLFDDCLKSPYTEAQVEEKVLKLLRKYCPEGECQLAGSSIHIDRDVLRQRMSKVFKFLHYRIIDVSSFRSMMKRWKPSRDAQLVEQLSHSGQETVNHRAMDDIEWSIALMKLYQPLFTAQPMPSKKKSSKHYPQQNFPVNRRAEPSREPRTELFNDEKTLRERIQLEKVFSAAKNKMNQTDLMIYEGNPHLREVFRNNQKLMHFKGKFEDENRFFNLGTGSIVSSSPGGASSMPAQTTEHWGTRKLLLTEIEFLTKNAAQKRGTVLYVGAAPGHHINALSDLFPDLDFILIDTKVIETQRTERIHIRSLKFLDDIIKTSKSKQPVYLISNIRTCSSQASMQYDIVQDMDDQRKWHNDLKSEASLLTFRFMRNESKIKFYEGDFVIEPWNSRRATDCRIVVGKGASVTTHDVQKLLKAISHFHNVERIMYYAHQIDETKSNGLDHCYDCRSEIRILEQYLKKVQKITDQAKISAEIPRLSSQLSDFIQDPTQPTFIKGKRTLDIIK